MLNELRNKNSINLIALIFQFAVFLKIWFNEMIRWFIFQVKSFGNKIREFYGNPKYLQVDFLSDPVSLYWLGFDVDWIDIAPVDFPCIRFEKFNCIGIWNKIFYLFLWLDFKNSICFVLFVSKQSTFQYLNESHTITELHSEFLSIWLGTIQ